MRSGWVIACALGEAIGIALVATIYAALDRGLLPGGAVWILAAGAWEGTCLGVAQAAVLRAAGIRPAVWVGATVLGAVIGYALSLIGGAGSTGGDAGAEPPLALLLGLGAAMGVAMGALMGVAQWLGARRKLRPLGWIAANAVGWAPAMSIIMFAAASVQPGWSLGAIALAGAGAGAAAGLLLGAVTSLALPKPALRAHLDQEDHRGADRL